MKSRMKYAYAIEDRKILRAGKFMKKNITTSFNKNTEEKTNVIKGK